MYDDDEDDLIIEEIPLEDNKKKKSASNVKKESEKRVTGKKKSAKGKTVREKTGKEKIEEKAEYENPILTDIPQPLLDGDEDVLLPEQKDVEKTSDLEEAICTVKRKDKEKAERGASPKRRMKPSSIKRVKSAVNETEENKEAKEENEDIEKELYEEEVAEVVREMEEEAEEIEKSDEYYFDEEREEEEEKLTFSYTEEGEIEGDSPYRESEDEDGREGQVLKKESEYVEEEEKKEDVLGDKTILDAGFSLSSLNIEDEIITEDDFKLEYFDEYEEKDEGEEVEQEEEFWEDPDQLNFLDELFQEKEEERENPERIDDDETDDKEMLDEAENDDIIPSFFVYKKYHFFPPLVSQIAEKVANDKSRFTEFALKAERGTLERLENALKRTLDKVKVENSDKMVTIYDANLSVIITADENGRASNDVLINAGSVMYEKKCDEWRVLIVFIDKEDRARYVREGIIRKNSFSPASWNRCEKIGEKLKARHEA